MHSLASQKRGPKSVAEDGQRALDGCVAETTRATRWVEREHSTLNADRDNGIVHGAVPGSHVKDAYGHEAHVGADEQAEHENGKDDPEHLCGHWDDLLPSAFHIVASIIRSFTPFVEQDCVN